MPVELSLSRGALPRLLIVGDIALFREGMLAALSRTERFEMVGAAAIGDALDLVSEGEIEVVVLDTSRRRALSQARLLSEASPGIGIVAFGISGVDDALACAEAGVRAFVGEDGSIEAICDAAMQAVHGLSACPPDLTAGLLDRFAAIARDAETRASERLTSREGEVARLVADGLSNKQIARELAISPATVKNHVHAILSKFDLPRRSAIGRQLQGAQPIMA
jgi:DNA-binding NarL/FixJ family response regulator